MGVLFHIFLKHMEQKTIPMRSFLHQEHKFTAFFSHSFIYTYMETWSNGYLNALLRRPTSDGSLGSSPGVSASQGSTSNRITMDNAIGRINCMDHLGKPESTRWKNVLTLLPSTRHLKPRVCGHQQVPLLWRSKHNWYCLGLENRSGATLCRFESCLLRQMARQLSW